MENIFPGSEISWSAHFFICPFPQWNTYKKVIIKSASYINFGLAGKKFYQSAVSKLFFPNCYIVMAILQPKPKKNVKFLLGYHISNKIVTKTTIEINGDLKNILQISPKSELLGRFPWSLACLCFGAKHYLTIWINRWYNIFFSYLGHLKVISIPNIKWQIYSWQDDDLKYICSWDVHRCMEAWWVQSPWFLAMGSLGEFIVPILKQYYKWLWRKWPGINWPIRGQHLAEYHWSMMLW